MPPKRNAPPDQPTPGNAGWAPWSQLEHDQSGVPESHRSGDAIRMKARSLICATLLAGPICFVAWAADDPPTQAAVIADLSVCELRYGGYGQCISELPDSQVLSSPAWDISIGSPPLLPAKAEAIAKSQVEAFVAPYAFRAKPLLLSYQRTRLIKRDATHWFYGIEFSQGPAGGSTGPWPSIEVFVTFDGKVGTLRLASPPKDK